MVATASVAQTSGSPLSQLPRNRWQCLHEQQAGDAVVFTRQAHGGSAFDSRRDRLVLFGSDTHGLDWTNTPLFFYPKERRWERPYPSDPPETYHVDADGLPVAGVNGDHPWAMHTFGAVDYDPAHDRLIVSSWPEHLTPGRFTDALAAVWPQVKRHPTWLFEFATNRWRPVAAPAVSMFAFATAYDPDRGIVIGYRSDGMYELGGEPLAWRRVASPGLLGYHNNAVYDSRHHVLIAFGSSGGGNDIVVYEPATQRHQIMPTPGPRPPPDEHVPLAFASRLGQVAAVVDHSLRDHAVAETWLYDFAADRWRQLKTATLPFALGMNYNLEYDARHDVLLLVTEQPHGNTSVWALRVE